jgi:hypothetical protein
VSECVLLAESSFALVVVFLRHLELLDNLTVFRTDSSELGSVG